MKNIGLSLLFCFCSLVLYSQNTLENRIQGLIDEMTVEEKIKQLHRNSFWTTETNTRLEIPGFVMSDGPHGVRFVDATSFPVGIGIAASWNKELGYDVGYAMGTEFHAYGKHQQLGPALDLCRDPRNGRSPETGGEDPFLCAHMNVEVTKGIQATPTIATIKHFNAVNKQVDRHNVNHTLTKRQLMEHYGYNFRRAVQDGGALSVMNAYNKVNGDKCAENSQLLTEILRGHWGFPFYVVSDWGSVWDVPKALKAGCNLEMDVDESAYEAGLQNAYDNGQITDADLDAALRNVLRVKFVSGMMDNYPVGDIQTGANTTEHQQLALQAGREACVLLKNEGNILPLSSSMTENIALIGPSINVAQLDGFGSSAVFPPYAITPYQGLLNKLPSAQVSWTTGCNINDLDTSGFAAARTMAASKDYVIFVGGLDESQEGENYSPGPVDRTGGSVELPATQQLLIKELAKVNPNIIVVLKSGGICALDNTIGDIKGLLYAFYPGMEGGNAIADVLFGDYNPSGKLPVTMPVNDSQLPAWDDSFSNDHEGGYRWYDNQNITPQYAFGFGLSYTTFSYSNMTISDTSYEAGEPITITVDVTNTGARAGEEIVQLYLENNTSLVSMPEKELKGFEKISLDTGETKTVTFNLTANELYYFNTTNDGYEIATGAYVARIGGSSDNLTLNKNFEITAGTATPDLEVSRIYSVPRFPQINDSVLFLAIVKNTGTQTINSGTNVKLAFAINGTEVSSAATIPQSIEPGGALLIGATTGTNGTSYWVPTDINSYQVTATIDSDSQISELIETNNTSQDSINVTDSIPEAAVNICYLKPVTATSNESADYKAENAVDGNFGTRWASEFSDPQAITVKLNGIYQVDSIMLYWEDAYSSDYMLETSTDSAYWNTVTRQTNADGGVDKYAVDQQAAYIRVTGFKRGTNWGHSLWEIQGFGNLISGIDEEDLSYGQIQVFPNPNKDRILNVKGIPEGNYTAQLIDATGCEVAFKRFKRLDAWNISKYHLPNGTYIMYVRDRKNGRVMSQKIILK